MARRAPAELWTVAEAAAADRHTMAGLGLPSVLSMERAALCVSAEVEAFDPSSVLVLCGPGNNGGDGFAVARQLHGRGVPVTAVKVTDRGNAAVAEQEAMARACGVRVVDALPSTSSASVIVDAMLGTGSKGAPRGGVARALAWLRSSARARPVVAVDVPTGVDPDTGAVFDDAVRAAVTVTMQRSKPGLHVTPGRAFAGEVVVADIGLVEPPPAEPTSTLASTSTSTSTSTATSTASLIDPEWVAAWLRAHADVAHKGQRGHVGVVAGSPGMRGAAVLAATAALRTGAGLVTVRAEDSALAARPELMATSEPTVPMADALVVGPGMTDGRGLDALDREDPRPMVWDAGGLEVIGTGPSAGPRVLTPHPGEAARLLDRLGDGAWTSARVQGQRIAVALTLAEITGATVVLKGAGTVVADGSRVALCTAGGRSLATAGSGDVLAGVVAAFLARGASAWDAARLGVYLHAIAGERLPSDGALALDIAEVLPATLAAPTGPWPRARSG